MAQLTLIIHTLVSYAVSGLILGFALAALLVRVCRITDPFVKIRIYSLTLFLPFVGYFTAGRLNTALPVNSLFLQKLFWLQCQLGNWAAYVSGPLAAVSIGLLVFHIAAALIGSRNWRKLPDANLCSDRIKILTLKVAEDMKIKIPDIYYWPGDGVKLFTTGFFKPAVVISNGLLKALDDRELADVLAHEFAHIKHRDTLKLLVFRVCGDILFFMPLVNSIARILAEEIEKAADLSAGHLNNLKYAATLLKVYRFQLQAGGNEEFQPAFAGGSVSTRLEMILEPPVKFPWWGSFLILTFISFIVIYFLSLVC